MRNPSMAMAAYTLTATAQGEIFNYIGNGDFASPDGYEPLVIDDADAALRTFDVITHELLHHAGFGGNREVVVTLYRGLTVFRVKTVTL